MADQPLEQTAQHLDPAAGESVIAAGIGFAEYLQRFAGLRTEWLAGKVIEHMPNNTRHQVLLLFLSHLLDNFLSLRGEGQVLLAGVPMFLGDDRPAREPDLMLVLGRHQERIRETYLEGPADLLVEIVSPESSTRDRGVKFDEYEAAGVAEYWLIDPLRAEAAIYTLAQDGRYRRLGPDADGKITSAVLPGFVLAAAVLWQDTLPRGGELLALVQSMA